MGTELPTKVVLGQTLVLMQMTFLNNVRKVGRLVISRTSCFYLMSLKTHGVSEPGSILALCKGPNKQGCMVLLDDGNRASFRNMCFKKTCILLLLRKP
jgi:hypothetical protein